MRKLIFTFCLLFSSFAFAAQPLTAADTKTKILIELKELKSNISAANDDLVGMQVMYRDVKNALKNLEDWAVEEQRQKFSYYEQLTKAVEQLNSVETRVEDAKKEKEQIDKKYAKAKLVLCYATASLLALLYLSTLSPILRPILAAASGVWYPAVMILTPALAFTAGYFIAYLYF